MNGKASTRFSLPLTFTLAVVVAACGGGDAESAAAQTEREGNPAALRSEAARIAACDLTTPAEIEAILGPLSDEPDSREGKYGSMNASSCAFSGTTGMVIVKVWHPYSGGESTSAAWAARVKEERESAPTGSDVEGLSDVGEITPYEGLGVPAAIEDIRAAFGIVELHASKGGRGGVYLAITAPDPEIAIAVAEKALARIP